MVDTKIEVESLPPVLVFLVRATEDYTPGGSWGGFDSLGIRSLQDLCFEPGSQSRVLYGFTSEPPHAEDVVAVSVPLQLALEAAFFHVSGIDELVLNPRGDLVGAAIPQVSLDFTVPDDCEPMVRIPRRQLPDLIGAVTAQAGRELSDELYVQRAARALQEGAYFECYHLAQRARLSNPGGTAGWFYELFALSFFGDADEALELYEQYPERGSAEPFAQLLAARFRLLLKQFNEARTILHTLSFNSEVGAIASTELARSYLTEKHYARALDAANAAISKNSELAEAYLLRGIALRGVSYEGGDVKGLQDSYADFERVAKRGGYGAAEALYHAGTVCARLGAIAEAETAFRQSLFQRDRVSARDGLIRTLCAQDRCAEAEAELLCLERLVPAYGKGLREQLGESLKGRPLSTDSSKTEIRESSELWAPNIADAVTAARVLLKAWGVPLECVPSDCGVIDDLINRFAPDGEFPNEGSFAALHVAGHEVVTRALALHIGELLVSRGAATWGTRHQTRCTVVSSRLEVEIPLEDFVADRILLGASGDNFSSLESLVMELEVTGSERRVCVPAQWWELADDSTIQGIEREVSWVSETLRGLGIDLSESLTDVEIVDQWIESVFDIGGSYHSDTSEAIPEDSDRLIGALGLLVGQRIVQVTGGEWYGHPKLEGISVWSEELGRIFPVARLQRRVYLAAAAESSVKLSSLAWSVAVASVTGEVRRGRVAGHDDVRCALIHLLPSIASFPEEELAGVVNSLLIGASLRGGVEAV